MRRLLCLLGLLLLPMGVFAQEDEALHLGDTIEDTFIGKQGKLEFPIQFSEAGFVDVTASTTASDYVPHVELRNPKDNIQQGVEAGSTSTVRLYVPAEGAYTAIISPANNGVGSDFTLSVKPAEIQPLEFGANPVIIDPVGVQYFSFEGEAGQVMNIRMEEAAGGGNRARFILRTPTQGSIAGSDPSVGAKLVRMVLPEDGTYFLEYDTEGHPTQTTYTIHLEETEIVSLDEGSQVIDYSTTPYTDTQVFHFQAAAGVTYRVDIVLDEPSFQVSVGISSSNAGETAITLYSLKRGSAYYTAREDGLLRVTVTGGGGAMWAEISVEAVEE